MDVIHSPIPVKIVASITFSRIMRNLLEGSTVCYLNTCGFKFISDCHFNDPQKVYLIQRLVILDILLLINSDPSTCYAMNVIDHPNSFPNYSKIFVIAIILTQ